jgi:hypothetical protein
MDTVIFVNFITLSVNSLGIWIQSRGYCTQLGTASIILTGVYSVLCIASSLLSSLQLCMYCSKRDRILVNELIAPAFEYFWLQFHPRPYVHGNLVGPIPRQACRASGLDIVRMRK